MSKEAFFKMTEEHYMLIPSELRERFLSSKRIDSDTHDWQENMNDPLFKKLYNKKKEVSKKLEERQYQLREIRRNEAKLYSEK